MCGQDFTSVCTRLPVDWCSTPDVDSDNRHWGCRYMSPNPQDYGPRPVTGLIGGRGGLSSKRSFTSLVHTSSSLDHDDPWVPLDSNQESICDFVQVSVTHLHPLPLVFLSLRSVPWKTGRKEKKAEKRKKEKTHCLPAFKRGRRRIGGTRDRPQEWRASIEVKRLERFCTWSACQDTDAIAHPKAR